MRQSEILRRNVEKMRHKLYVVSLEKWIRKNGGKEFLKSLREESYILRRDRLITKKLQQFPKSESASTSSPTSPLTDTGT